MPANLLPLAVTLAAVVLLVAAAKLYKRTHTPEDFLIARRRLSPLTAALSAAVVQLPPWLIFAVALLAFQIGPDAIAIACAAWVGTLVGAFWLAPRARRHAQRQASYTIASILNVEGGEKMQIPIRRSIVAIALFALCFAMAAQAQWLSLRLAAMIGVPIWLVLCVGLLVLFMAALLGGLWLAAAVDTCIAFLALLLIAVIAAVALNANGWPTVTTPTVFQWEQPDWAQQVLLTALWVGVAFLITASLAHPAMLPRYFAERLDARPLRWMAPIWSGLILAGAILIGFCARNQVEGVAASGDVPTQLSQWLLADVANAAWLLMLLIGFAAQLSHGVALAGLLGHHWTSLSSNTLGSEKLSYYRGALALTFALTLGWAALLQTESFQPMWFAWHALGAAFAPLIIVRLTGKRVRAGSMLGSIWAGFALTIIFHLMPDTPGDLMERGLPFITAMGIALSGGDQRRNPDRADRGQQTVHDRLPI